ncbi:MAG: alpha/beta fold hydrolase [Acidimicrobiales bacterium]
MAMTRLGSGVELFHERFGDPERPTVLLVCGLGSQCTNFDVELCELIVERGFGVVRFDNRDCGLSTHFDAVAVDVLSTLAAAVSGEPVSSPFTLSDMAADAVGLLDALGVESAHVVGTSMGGMIAQAIAIEHPERVRSLTSVMSTTGERGVGDPTPECMTAMAANMAIPAEDFDSRVEAAVTLAELIGTPSVFDVERVRTRAKANVTRCYHPAGTQRQMVAILASGSRAAGLAGLDVPTVVMHGDLDPLVDISGGRRTAELVPGAEFRLMDAMGHDLPPTYWDRFVDGIVAAADRAGG